MMKSMKFYFLLLITFCFGAQLSLAYDLTVTEITKPYDIVPLDYDLSRKQVFLGELADFPIMYEAEVGEEAENFKVAIRQRYYSGSEPIDFSLILIRQNDNNRGVTEIARLNPKAENWTVVKDAKAGMMFWESQPLENELLTGLYRLEISTPENIGRFMLTFGDTEVEESYFKELANIYNIQKFFGYSIFKILSSSMIYYLLGIIFLLIAIQKTWKYRNKIKYGN